MKKCVYISFFFLALILTWCNNRESDYKIEAVEVYYCRWAWNSQFDSNMFSSKTLETMWEWWFTSEEWEKHNTAIDVMYKNCVNYKKDIRKDIEKYSYLEDSIKIDDSVLAYCLWEWKYLQAYSDAIDNKQYDWSVEKFSPSVVIKDDSFVFDVVKSCSENLAKNPKLFVNNIWQ